MQGTKAAVAYLKHSQKVRSGIALTLQPYWLIVYSTALQNFRFYSVYLTFSQSTAATTVESILQFGGHSEERRP